MRTERFRPTASAAANPKIRSAAGLNPSMTPALVDRDDAVDRRVEDGAGAGLALVEGALGLDAGRDVLREQDDASHNARGVPPGPGLPPEPLDVAIGSLEGVVGGAENFAQEGPAVDLAPPIGDFGRDVVVRAALEVVGQAVVAAPPAARGEVPHVAVEHGEGGGGVLDEDLELGLALPKGTLGV